MEVGRTAMRLSVFADLVRLEIELWEAVDARIGGVLSDPALDQLHRAITKLRAAPAATSGAERRRNRTYPPTGCAG
jgi:hypothetical protein